MKHFYLLILVQLAVAACFAQEYKPTDAGSSVTFEIKNFGFNSKGSFNGLEGKITFDPKDLPKSSFDVSIDAASVNTDNNMRDDHLKKDGYFDVEKYPRIRLVSTTISPADKNGRYILTGKLTIKNTTKDVAIPFIATLMGDDYIFKGDLTIDRKDYGVGGSSTLSNSVKIMLTVLAKHQ